VKILDGYIRSLDGYVALAGAAMRQRLVYRNSFLTGVASHLFFALALIYFWRAVFAGRETLHGFSWPELETYLLLTFCTNVVLGWNTEMAIVLRILDGRMAVDLLRPSDFQLARMAEGFGVALLESVMMIVVLVGVALVLGGISPPRDLATLVLALSSFGLGLVIKFAIMYITCVLAFWTHSSWGIAHARTALVRLFSGGLVPLSFMPEWLRELSEALPFQGIVYLPSTVYLGRSSTSVGYALATQAGWAVALLLVGRTAFARGLRKVTIHGG
jgi:ABC-2 type transport system permease protein